MFSREKTCRTVRSMNITVNGSSSWSCSSLINLEAGKIGATVALSLLLVVSLIGNLLIVLIVYKTPTIVVAFFICLIPMFSNVMISVLSAPISTISCSFYLYNVIAIFMSLANCAINPIICLIFSSNYRQALKRLANCCNTGQD